MTVSDDELTERMLGHIVEVPRKSARAVMSALQDIGYLEANERLYGYGRSGPDELLDRCIALMKSFAADGRIEVAGDLSKPRYSEVWLKTDRSGGPVT